ncbi:hypothetical protein ABIF93_002164 [Bradyrhizobium japonicum]
MVGQSLSKMRGLVLRRYSSKTHPPSKDNMELVISHARDRLALNRWLTIGLRPSVNIPIRKPLLDGSSIVYPLIPAGPA